MEDQPAVDWNGNAGTLTLEEEGSYQFTVAYTDSSENPMDTYTSPELRVDKTDPVITVTWDKENDAAAANADCYQSRTMTVTVEEENFRSSDFKVTAQLLDVTGAPVANAGDLLTAIQAHFAESSNWNREDNRYTASYELPEAVISDLQLACSDMLDWHSEQLIETFTVDHTGSEILDITYSEPKTTEEIAEALTLGFYQAKAIVTVRATDAISGVNTIEWSYARQEGASVTNEESLSGTAVAVPESEGSSIYVAEISLPEEEAQQLRGSLTVRAKDRAANSGAPYTDGSKIIVVDTIAPELEVSYSEAFLTDKDGAALQTVPEDGEYVLNYATDFIATLNVNEANFYTDDITVSVTKNGEPMADSPVIKWADSNTDEHQGTFTISGAGIYYITIEAEDHSGNTASYTSPEIRIDMTPPEINVVFAEDETAYNDYYYNLTRNATVSITEENFDAQKVYIDVTALDIAGDAIDEAQDIEDALNKQLHTAEKWSCEGNKHSIELAFSTDAQYAFSLDCSDVANNTAETWTSDTFVVDHEAPTDLEVSYDSTPIEKIEEGKTYFFYRPTEGGTDVSSTGENDTFVTITIQAKDITSGVDYFTWSYNREDGASESNVEAYLDRKIDATPDAEDSSIYTAEIILPESIADQLRGSITFYATDMANNSSDPFADDNYVVVVDTIAPYMTVSYSKANETEEDGKQILNYASEFTATLTVTEANFYEENVVVSLYKDAKAVESPMISWNADQNQADTYVGEFTVSDPGVYTMDIQAEDYSGNVFTYQSPEIRIDTAPPLIDVSFSPATAVADEISYYNVDCKATVSITEEHFDPAKVAIAVTAQDIAGDAVDIEKAIEDELNLHLQTASEWTSNGNEHSIDLVFTADAKYTFTLSCRDDANNPAEDYVAKAFVVDHTAPTDLKVTYTSTPKKLVEEEGVTYGFYRPDEEESDSYVTITIQAKDITSGVDYFTWSYNREDGASESNVEAYLDRKIDATPDSKDSSLYTAEIILPESIADQLRGSITFYATDMATNSSDPLADDNYVIVVDTIAPGRDVAYSEAIVLERDTMIAVDEYEEGDDVILYDQDKVVVTLTIKEANFYSEDVKLAVKKDGVELPAEQMPEITWQTAEQADTYLGTFSLTEEGDYTFEVTMEDHSGNVMATYNSHEIHIDRTAPVISVEYTSDAEAKNGKYFKADRTAIITIVEHNYNCGA